MPNKFERFMNIIFYIVTSLCVIFTFQYFFGVDEGHVTTYKAFVGIILLLIYFFSYYCHKEIDKYILKTYYVEKESYNTILKELIKKVDNDD